MDTSNMVFVFGSNLAGIHGAGAAKYAFQHKGATYGIGHGRTGQSYAIPTKDCKIISLRIDEVKLYTELFKDIARQYNKPPKEYEFQVTRIGCGLAGFTDEQIAPLFKNSPDNCYFDEAWRPYLGNEYKYWGTF